MNNTSKTRIFVKQDYDGSFQVLKLEDDQIDKGSFMENNTYSISIQEVENKTLKETFTDVSEYNLSVAYLENNYILTEQDVEALPHGNLFENYLKDIAFHYQIQKTNGIEKAIEHYNKYYVEGEDKFSLEKYIEILQYIQDNFSTGIEWIEPLHFWEYWDGSNWKTIQLTGEYADYQEVEESEYNNFVVDKVLDEKNKGTYEESLVITNSGKKAIITESFMQGEITNTWEFIDPDYVTESLQDFHEREQR